MKKILLGISFLTVISISASAQKGDLLYADAQFELENFLSAALEYQKIYELSPDYLIARRIALCYDKIYEFSLSREWWKKVVAYSEVTREDYLFLIEGFRRSGEEDSISVVLHEGGYELSDFPELVREVSVSEVPYRIYEIRGIEGFNSTGSDYSLFQAQDGFRLFASNRGEALKKDGKNLLRLDIIGTTFSKWSFHSNNRRYYGLYSQEGSGPVTPIMIEGFTLFHVTDPMLLSDGETIFFTATPKRERFSDEAVYPGIFRGKYDREASVITDVIPFPLNRTDRYGVMNPVLDEPNKRLYFSSSMDCGIGGHDIYYSEYGENWDFGNAVNLGPGVNTRDNERDAFSDGNYLYFSSNGRKGFGGLDVYRIKLDSISSGKVENLGSPVNTPSDDFGFRLIGSEKAIMSSDRRGGLGFDDLYSVAWTDRHVKLSAAEGTVIETKNGEIISLDELAKRLYDKSKEEVWISSPGFFREKRTLNWDPSIEEIVLDLKAVPVGLEVYESLIFYDLDQDDLREESKMVLDEIVGLMRRHPELVLSVESHTDSRASVEYNLNLSERRSISVRVYLQEKGIESERISVSPQSELKPTNDCIDGVSCPEFEHQKNRRSELMLVAFPEGGKVYEFPKGSSPEDFASSEDARLWFLKK